MDLLSDEAFDLSFTKLPRKDGCLISDASFYHGSFFYHENMIHCPYNKESIALETAAALRFTKTATYVKLGADLVLRN